MSDIKTETRRKIAPKTDLAEPDNYNVIYINDDVTAMEFVVESLKTVFNYSHDSAEALTMKVHADGSAVVATLPYEIAEQKGIEATLMARSNGYPLQIKIEADR
jgi:ATP-dependent Clp protease adaptor protein ClpS